MIRPTRHVLHLGKYFPPVRGGIEQVTFELAEGMYRLGTACSVLCFHQRRETQQSNERGYPVIRASTWGIVASQPISIAMFPQLFRLWRRHRNNLIVHMQVPNPLAGFYLLLLPSRLRTVIHWQSDILRQKKPAMLEWLEQKLLARAAAIITTSPAYGTHSSILQRWQQKLVVIPIGIEDESRQAAPRILTADTTKNILAVGRLVEYKGFANLVAGLPRLPPGYHVQMVGSGPLEPALREQARRLGVADRVHFLGDLSRPALLDAYRDCDVFCLPSITRAEAFGVVLLEAMSAGKPLITTRIEGSGISWVNVDGVTGLTVPVGDSDALASAARCILETPGLGARMGAAARARYLSEFTADKMVERVLALYDQVDARPVANRRGLERKHARRS